LIDDIDLEELEDDLLLAGGTYLDQQLVSSKTPNEAQDERPVVNRAIGHQLGLG